MKEMCQVLIRRLFNLENIAEKGVWLAISCFFIHQMLMMKKRHVLLNLYQI